MEQVVFEQGSRARPDGAVLATYMWQASDAEWAPSPRAVVYLAHGMAEHAGRYDEFARFLVAQGFEVHAHDHRGHGLTATGGGRTEPLGHAADTGGWDLLLADLLARLAEVTRPDAPLVLIGHSMGSFLAREVAIRLAQDRARLTRAAHLLQPPVKVAAYVLIGTGGPKGRILEVGKAVSGALAKTRGASRPSKLMDRVLFGEFNRAFAPSRTDFDWLSRDPASVDDYVADPLCGFVCSAAFYRDLLAAVARVNSPANLTSLPSDTPVLLLAGEADGVGDKGVGVRAAAAQYRAAGLTDVTCVLYLKARHEVLNETNKESVMRDIARWLDGRVARPDRAEAAQ